MNFPVHISSKRRLLMVGIAVPFLCLGLMVSLSERELTLPVSALSGSTTQQVESDPILRPILQSIKTISSFVVLKETETEIVPYEAEYVKDNELFIGDEVVAQTGINGSVIRNYDVSYWNGVEYFRTLLETETVLPQNKIIAQGTKKNIRLIDTPNGQEQYYLVYKMKATSYDGNCKGCTGITYLGTPVTVGVCAVDPKVIPLRSVVYIPGYGKCRAEDIGGGVKGMMIDLGFDDVRQGWWSTRYTDVYILEP